MPRPVKHRCQKGLSPAIANSTGGHSCNIGGRDLIAIAQTGTGKTASFSLPILHLLATKPRAQPNAVSALIIAPTRELAAQVAENVDNYSQNLNIRSTAVFGGVRIEPQKYTLVQGVDILIATPGRLVDLYK